MLFNVAFSTMTAEYQKPNLLFFIYSTLNKIVGKYHIALYAAQIFSTRCYNIVQASLQLPKVIRQLAFLSRIANDVQLMFRRPPRQQYAALCYRVKKKTGDLEVLLLTSRDTGRWVIPKGWPMPGKLSHEVAAREAYEEAGVRGTVETEPLGTFGYDKMLKDGIEVPCRVQVYALEVSELAKHFKEKGERSLEWVSCEVAAERVREPELHDLILAFAERMKTAPAVVPAK
jgi:8-oxo-dGTP pyrophosphatase MutT (NUDIX family)